MRRDVRSFVEVQNYFLINVVVKHIRTEHNKLAEMLRRGKRREAEMNERKEGPVVWKESEGIIRTWEDYLCDGIWMSSSTIKRKPEK